MTPADPRGTPWPPRLRRRVTEAQPVPQIARCSPLAPSVRLIGPRLAEPCCPAHLYRPAHLDCRTVRSTRQPPCRRAVRAIHAGARAAPPWVGERSAPPWLAPVP